MVSGNQSTKSESGGLLLLFWGENVPTRLNNSCCCFLLLHHDVEVARSSSTHSFGRVHFLADDTRKTIVDRTIIATWATPSRRFPTFLQVETSHFSPFSVVTDVWLQGFRFSALDFMNILFPIFHLPTRLRNQGQANETTWAATFFSCSPCSGRAGYKVSGDLCPHPPSPFHKVK
jgi:hypothetical protein